jgi:hypothetical protein
MIELGAYGHTLAIYQRDVTDDTFQCALDLTYGDLYVWYEPVYFALMDVPRFAAELEAVIDARRTVARLAATRATMPDICITVMSLPESADYGLRLDVLPHPGGHAAAEQVVVTLDIPHASLMAAFRELRHHVSEEKARTARPLSIDIGASGLDGCELKWQFADDCVVYFDAALRGGGVGATKSHVHFLDSHLMSFADAIDTLAAGEGGRADLESLDHDFRMSIVPEGRWRTLWAEVTLDHHDFMGAPGTEVAHLTSRFAVRSPVLAEAARTIRALISRGATSIDVQR